MEQNIEKISVLVVGYDGVKDYRQFKIAVLKSVNLNIVNKMYFIDKPNFTEQMEQFCKEFKVEFEKMAPLPAKPSNQQTEKLSQVKALVIFNNGEDKRIKKYETLVKNLQVYTKVWKVKNGNLILK